MTLDYSQLGFYIVKFALAVFMLIHVLAVTVIARQATLASRVIVSEGNKRVVTFTYLYVIILVVILLVIVTLPFI